MSLLSSSILLSGFSLPSLVILLLCRFLCCHWVLRGPLPSLVILPLCRFLCCHWVLRGLSVCDLFGSKVPLATGSPVGLSPFCFLLAPSSFPPVVSSDYFVGSSLVFVLLSLSGIITLPSPFLLDSFLSFSAGGVVLAIFSSFSFRSAFWDYCFSIFCPLPFFVGPQWGSWRNSYFVGVSPFWVSPLVLGPLSPWSLRVSFFRSLFWPFHLCCSLSPWCILSVLLVSALGLSFICLRASFVSLSISPLGGSRPFLRVV